LYRNLKILPSRELNTEIMDKNFSRVKISDIAEQAGVSAGTVDRVIHNRGEVAPKTREKIMKIIGEMNYEPDILASTLASKKNYRFAALIPEADTNNPFWHTPAEGLQDAWEEIRHFGITLEKHFFTYHHRDAYSRKLKAIIKDHPSGVILAPVFTEQTIKHLRELRKLGIPVVFLNTRIDNQDNMAFVGQDPIHSGKVAARLMDFGLDVEAEIFIINIISEKGGNNHILNREKGFRQFFKNVKGNKKRILNTLNINSQAPDELDLILQRQIGKKNPGLCKKGIFVTNSKVFQVASYLEKNDLTNYTLIGYDLLEQTQQFLKKGVIDFLISQKPREQGYKSVMALFNYLVMKKQVIKDQFLPIDIITKENIDFYINQ
jgi:LacI family transcriptional regulator